MKISRIDIVGQNGNGGEHYMQEPKDYVPPKGQSRLGSAVESVCNTSSGFLVAMFVSIVVYPIYGWKPTIETMFQLTIIFTTTSVIRSYLWRRLFNWVMIRYNK